MSGPTKCRAWSGSKLFDTLMVFPKEFYEKNDLEKKADDKKHAMLPSMQRLLDTSVKILENSIFRVLASLSL